MIGYNKVPAARGAAWLVQGAALLRAAPRPWLALAAVYLLLAIALEQIPFIGRLILILLSPLLLLGVLPYAARAGADHGPASLPALLAEALRRLFAGLRDREHLMPIAVLATLILGGLVAIQILAQLLKANPGALFGTVTSGVSSSVWMTALIGVVVVLGLEVLLVMAMLYAVPLIAFRDAHPLPSIAASFAATRGNFGAFVLFGGAFLLAGLAARVLFHRLAFPFDYLAFLAIGLVALPLFVGGLYASYREQFADRPG